MRKLIVFAVLLVAVGCGDDKPAQPGNPSAEQIKADLDHQKQVEQEERGTPVKPGKKR
jgi:hypothetical protein